MSFFFPLPIGERVKLSRAFVLCRKGHRVLSIFDMKHFPPKFPAIDLRAYKLFFLSLSLSLTLFSVEKFPTANKPRGEYFKELNAPFVIKALKSKVGVH